MSDDNSLGNTETQQPQPRCLAHKIGLGAALLAVPIGAALGYLKLQENSDRISDKTADFDPGKFASIDPAMIRYQKVRDIATGLRETQAMAIDASGRLLVAGDNCVRFFGETGDNPADIKLSGTPTALATSADGRVLIAFRDHVEIYNADGTRDKTWKSLDAKAIITGLAIHGSDVYVADSGNKIVLHCDLDGNIINTIGGYDPNRKDSGLILPSPHLNVAALADGNVLISNPGRLRMETYSSDGTFRGTIAEAGVGLAKFEGCCNPSNMAVMADGRIVTAEKGIARVKVYTADGKLDGVVAGPDIFGQSSFGLQLAADRSGRVWVMEPGSTTVRVFAPKSVKAEGL